ncbi:nitrile hydratase subunit beta [Palleronia abyssalis]|uniref:Nitrile hydratase subunit beta n=1 Tax=Palleronia abyssalis TaxID=1501240 RepID=A0A2R8BXB7_9RHOB|nr:nitrile hydratase subunit beta [Palleronia abyssalis]SPJ24799.1 Low-molecular weight cobalt-containing nitrile hydratase subunit beta [Palleronia abyssalis]
MTRIHDMGGRFGDGPVTPEPEGARVFAEAWHARALALTLASGSLGQWTLDRSRHARERLAPADYATFTYYEKWVAALTDLLVETETITRAELEGGETALSPLAGKRLASDTVPDVLSKGAPTDRRGPPPAFAVGDAVATRRPPRNDRITGGHTRLPAYASGHIGNVIASHGSHVFPDTNAHALGEGPEPLYTVAFSARDLWGPDATQGDEVMLDLWQSYLKPA